MEIKREPLTTRQRKVREVVFNTISAYPDTYTPTSLFGVLKKEHIGLDYEEVREAVWGLLSMDELILNPGNTLTVTPVEEPWPENG